MRYYSRDTANYFKNFQKACERKSDDLLTLAKTSFDTMRHCSVETEKAIHPSYNLLFNYLSQALSQNIAIASVHDADIFGAYFESLGSLNKLRIDGFRCTESPICSLSRLSGYPVDEIIRNLKQATNIERPFLRKLLCQDNRLLLNCLEHQLHFTTIPQLSSQGITHEKGAMLYLASRLYDVGSSKKLNAELTGLHYRTLDGFYKDGIKSKCRKDGKLAKFIAGKMVHQDFSSYSMLMISLYIICARVLLNSPPGDNHFDVESVPTEISIHLCIGVYNSCRMFKAHIRENCMFIGQSVRFPRFDEFYDVLKLFIQRNARPIACSHCNHPYLHIDHANVESYESVPCPVCNKKAEYCIE